MSNPLPLLGQSGMHELETAFTRTIGHASALDRPLQKKMKVELKPKKVNTCLCLLSVRIRQSQTSSINNVFSKVKCFIFRNFSTIIGFMPLEIANNPIWADNVSAKSLEKPSQNSDDHESPWISSTQSNPARTIHGDKLLKRRIESSEQIKRTEIEISAYLISLSNKQGTARPSSLFLRPSSLLMTVYNFEVREIRNCAAVAIGYFYLKRERRERDRERAGMRVTLAPGILDCTGTRVFVKSESGTRATLFYPERWIRQVTWLTMSFRVGNEATPGAEWTRINRSRLDLNRNKTNKFGFTFQPVW